MIDNVMIEGMIETQRDNFPCGYEQDHDERVMRSVKVNAPNFDVLLDEWQTLRQDDMPVVEYIAKFEEFMLRCDIREDRRMTLSRFRSGLRPELQRELIPHNVNTFERVFQIVQELEKYLKSSNVVKRIDPYKFDFRAGTFGTRPNNV
ncbi:unnamed protein product [Prunus armeniaca]